MPIYKGSTKIGVIKKGSTNIKKVYHGSTIVFGKEVFEQTFATNGTVTFPASMFSLKVIVVGSGGSGGNFGNFGDYYVGGGGGGAGGGLLPARDLLLPAGAPRAAGLHPGGAVGEEGGAGGRHRQR